MAVACIEGQDSAEDPGSAGDRGTAEGQSYWVVEHTAVDSMAAALALVVLVETLPWRSESDNLPGRDCLSNSSYTQ